MNFSKIKSRLDTFDPSIPEYFVDFAFEEEHLKAIPIVGTIISLVKAAKSIQERLYAKRLLDFLVTLEKIPKHNTHTLINKMSSDEGKLEQTGNNILNLLANISDEKKPKFMGIAFVAYLQEELTYDELDRVRHILNHCFLSDISQFSTLPDESTSGIEILTLQAFGLYYIDIGQSTCEALTYIKTDFGKKITKIWNSAP